MKVVEALKLYGNYQRNMLNRSENTITSYASDIKLYFENVGENLETTQTQAEKYFSMLAQQGISATSRNRKITALKMFYGWLCDNGYVGENPMLHIAKPKNPQKKVKVIGSEGTENLFTALRESKKNVDYFRNLALIYTLISTGIRREELTNIKLNDVNLAESSILITGKGNKQRIVYFNGTAKALLSEYLASHRAILKYAEQSEYLFLSNCSPKMSTRTVNRIVDDVFTRAGIKEQGRSVHALRKVFATTIYKATKDIVVVQNLLGHESPQTTMRYIGIDESAKRQAVQNINF